ncbi:MAG TPA: four helix bundle protein [Polyangiaceae bacterium]
MQLDHERLDVYDLALEFLVLANGIIEGLPRGRSHLADQFTRASLSIVLNLAEGAGKHSKLDKRRYYVTARGSATESAAAKPGLLEQVKVHSISARDLYSSLSYGSLPARLALEGMTATQPGLSNARRNASES